MQIKKLTCLLMSLLIVVALLWLWQQSKSELPRPLTGSEKVDFFGRKVVIPKEKPQRIVSLSPCNTEILFALGAGDRVVGVTSFSDYPIEAQEKPNIGPYNSPDIEKIVALSPDMVFAMRKFQTRYIKILERAGIPVVVVDPETLPDILTAVNLISEIIGESESGLILHKKLTQKLETVQQQLSAAASKRVFLEVWDVPLITAGRKSFLNDLITRAGGINVAASSDVDYLPCDIEKLYSYDLEIYVVLSHNKNDLRSIITRKELSNIAAVKYNMIFQINDDIIARPGPRCFDGLWELARIIHPDMKDD